MQFKSLPIIPSVRPYFHFRADSCLLVYLSENAYALKMMVALCPSFTVRINIRVFSTLAAADSSLESPKVTNVVAFDEFCMDEATLATIHLIFFIRDAALEETSLMSLIFWTNLFSLYSNICLLPTKFKVVS